MSERMTARKRQALEMRSRIQSAALDLFDREGFENVSVEEIAQTAGCSVGNIYHYFKSKDELAIQVTSHVDDAYSELEEAYLADTARCWTLWAGPWRSACRTRCCIRRLSTGCGIRSSGCCRKTPGGYTSGCCWSW